MVLVRPALAKGLSPLEAAAVMEAHARSEIAMACEAAPAHPDASASARQPHEAGAPRLDRARGEA